MAFTSGYYEIICRRGSKPQLAVAVVGPYVLTKYHSISEVKETICWLRPPYFIVTKYHRISEATKRLFSILGHQISLWPNNTAYQSSQRYYLPS